MKVNVVVVEWHNIGVEADNWAEGLDDGVGADIGVEGLDDGVWADIWAGAAGV